MKQLADFKVEVVAKKETPLIFIVIISRTGIFNTRSKLNVLIFALHDVNTRFFVL